MTRVFFTTLINGGPVDCPALPLAITLGDEFGLAAGIVLTLLGMALHWRIPHERIAIEELMKDGRLDERVGRRRLRIYRLCAPIAAAGGFLLLVLQLAVLAD